MGRAMHASRKIAADVLLRLASHRAVAVMLHSRERLDCGLGARSGRPAPHSRPLGRRRSDWLDCRCALPLQFRSICPLRYRYCHSSRPLPWSHDASECRFFRSLFLLLLRAKAAKMQPACRTACPASRFPLYSSGITVNLRAFR